MEIIDCFCGIGPWRQRDKLLPYEPADTIELMDHFGVAWALVYSNMGANYGWPPDSNRIVIEAAAQEDRFLPALALAPHAYDRSPKPDDYLDDMRACGARAAWMWPASRQGYGPWGWLLGDLLGLCAKRRIPLFMNMAEVSPDDVHRLAGEFPKLRLVLTGVSYGADSWLYPLLRLHPGLHVCLGQFYIPACGPAGFVQHFSPERLLFGSGLPHFSPGGLVAHVMYADIEADAKALILAGNLKRLLAEAEL